MLGLSTFQNTFFYITLLSYDFMTDFTRGVHSINRFSFILQLADCFQPNYDAEYFVNK